jgi:hypothetical protein
VTAGLTAVLRDEADARHAVHPHLVLADAIDPEAETDRVR